MSTQQSLDTNIVLRLIIGDIPAQRDAAMELIETSPGFFHVADIVFVEIEYALRQHYGLSRGQIAELLQDFTDHAKVVCSRALLAATLSIYTHKPALSFTDIMLAEYARLSETAPLWTFDKKLALQSASAELLGY